MSGIEFSGGGGSLWRGCDKGTLDGVQLSIFQLWRRSMIVIESLVQSRSLTSRGLDRDRDWSTKAPIPQKTGLDRSKTAKN